MTKVYRDANGRVVNIGDWDFLEDIVINEDTGESITIQHNPLPEGLTISDEVVISGWDGGLYVEDDPRAVEPE